MENKQSKVSNIIITVILWAVGLIMVIPLIWMLSTSFKFEADVFSMPIQWIPEKFNFNNYSKVITDFPYVNWYINTIIETLSIVLLILVFSSLSGYAFAKLNFKGKNLIFMLFISTMMIPAQIRIIPQFVMFKSWGIINTLVSIIIPWAYNAFSIFLMKQFFESIPNDLIEAASIDGSGEYRTFFSIVMPLAKTQLSALTILAFTWGWNEYFSPLVYINKLEKQVLSVGIAACKTAYSENFAVQMAGATMALVPVIAVYLCFQKKLIEGIAMSGIKG